MTIPAVIATVSTSSDEKLEADEDELGIPSSQRFILWLIGLVILGVGARILFVVRWSYGKPLQGDPLFFQNVGASLAHGMEYAQPFLDHGKPVATALHPPVFPIVLASLDLVRIQSADAHRIALAFISAACIPLMGLLGRRLLSPFAGLLAAGIAAFGPLWIQPSGKVLSESVYLIVIPILLLAALRCMDRPRGWSFLAVGLVMGLATLTRSEGLYFVFLLGIPLLLFAARSWADRARFGLVLMLGFVLVVGPWIIRNDVEMGGFVVSTNTDTTIVGAYTGTTFDPRSPIYGSFDENVQLGDAAVLVKWGHPPSPARSWTERTLSDALGHIGVSYARAHLSDLPGVILAREGRLWGVYRPGSQLQFDLASDGDGVRSVQLAGQYLNWALLPLAVGGAVVLYRGSRRNLVIVLSPIFAAAISAAVAFGSTRYRAVAEPSLALLASLALAALVQHIPGYNRRWYSKTALSEGSSPEPV